MIPRRPLLFGTTALALAACTRQRGATIAPSPDDAPPPEPSPPRTLLVLGGTRFLGPAIVQAALADGWTVTLFNRGKSNPHLFPELEKLQGDRDPKVGDGLRALEGRTFDAVIDTSGYFPRHVDASARLLADNVGQYVFISSVSVYANNDEVDQPESATLATIPDPTVETMGEDFSNYGALKALCEQAAERAMPGRVANVRPGYIVGPDDPTDRFTYWPVRVAAGGDVLAPGTAADPIQIIDVRDLGEFLVRLCATKTMGPFNAVGPAQPLTMGELLSACQRAAGVDARFTWVDAAFLKDAAERSKVFLPIWVPPVGETIGFHRRSHARALAAGLRTRPVEDTVRATLEWFSVQPAERQATLRAGITREQEAELLARFATGDRSSA